MTSRSTPPIAALAVAAFAVAGCQGELPPLGEAVFFVDTDLPVPGLASSLRVDVYSDDGIDWYEHRETELPDPLAWPASFSIFDPSAGAGKSALVRLRVYPRGYLRDYRGERFGPRPSGGAPLDDALLPDPPDGELPRLVEQGEDLTPPSEPDPSVAVDAFVRLRLSPGEVGAVRVTMRGACIGTMADLATASSCVDTQGVVVPAAEPKLDPDTAPRGSSVAGTFGAPVPCALETRPPSFAADGTPLFDDEVCVPGGSFVFGNHAPLFYDTTPERAAILPPFRMDRFEVTVGRYRAALATGFVSPDPSPVGNEGPLDLMTSNRAHVCTWSASPRGRETLPLNCVTIAAARALCRHFGGDVASEVQWEYVAQAVGRADKTTYPWGDLAPTCATAVFSLDPFGDVPAFAKCVTASTMGPLPEDAASHPGGDVSPGLGVVNLGGSMAEVLRDPYATLGSNCWVGAPLLSPACAGVPDDAPRAIRGGAWFDEAGTLDAALRGSTDGQPAIQIGVRCVRE